MEKEWKRRVITESELRDELEKDGDLSRYVMPEGAIITPAAWTLLADRKIPVERLKSETVKPAKPEHRTHLNKDILVSKTNKRIRFRGKLDSLEAKIILAPVRLTALHQKQLVEDLQELMMIVRSILRAEVTEEFFSIEMFMGMTEKELREVSHNPQEKLGVSHFIPDYQMGEEMALLNWLRTETRETELAACDAFMSGYENGSVKRPDILRSLNRLSSAIYFMMCRLKSGFFYQGGEEPGRRTDSPNCTKSPG